jgi:hypothetical protein
MLSVMLTVAFFIVMLSVVMLSIIMLNAVAPLNQLSFKISFKTKQLLNISLKFWSSRL